MYEAGPHTYNYNRDSLLLTDNRASNRLKVRLYNINKSFNSLNNDVNAFLFPFTLMLR